MISKHILQIRIISILLVLCFFSLFLVSIMHPTEGAQTLSQDDWYYLPSYANYAPSGMPDFDQKQDNNWTGKLGWSFCGPTALADVLWWFDSKHEDQNGIPGDGVDSYPLVKDYKAPGSPQPGPNSDDHNFNNVNDAQTSWQGRFGDKELIDELAWYTNTNLCRIPFIEGFGGTGILAMKRGFERWCSDAGLKNEYQVEILKKPSFSTVNERVRNNEAVILRLGFYIPGLSSLSVLSYHYIVVAGINSNGSIAVSDPEWDNINKTKDPTLHNDARIVSHDIYQVYYTTPYPRLASWWMPVYVSHRRVVVTHAIIFSEIE